MRRTRSTTGSSRTGRAAATSPARSPRSTTSSSASSSELAAEGYCVVPFAELFPEPAAWSAIEEQAARFVADTEAGLAGDREALRVRAGKEFVVRLQSYGVELGLDDPWFATCASHRMLDIANTYLGLWSKLEYVDLWYSVPQPADADRIAVAALAPRLQRQAPPEGVPLPRRRRRGHRAVRVRPGQRPRRRYADAWPWRPLGDNYPPDGELEQRIPEDGIRTFTAPKGTMVFCNTSGFHRGGFATERPRVLATVTYSSPASLASLTERSYRFTGSLDELDAPTRFALT